MAAHGQHRPRDFTPRGSSAHSACGAPSLSGSPATRTGDAGRTAREDNSQFHRVPAGPSAFRGAWARQPGYGWGGQGFHRLNTEPAHAANRRVQRGPPAKTTPTSLASGPWPRAFTGTRARQLETEGDRQAVPQADRRTDGSSCAAQPAPFPERTHDRSCQSRRLKRHEDHRRTSDGMTTCAHRSAANEPVRPSPANGGWLPQALRSFSEGGARPAPDVFPSNVFGRRCSRALRRRGCRWKALTALLARRD